MPMVVSACMLRWKDGIGPSTNHVFHTTWFAIAVIFIAINVTISILCSVALFSGPAFQYIYHWFLGSFGLTTRMVETVGGAYDIFLFVVVIFSYLKPSSSLRPPTPHLPPSNSSSTYLIIILSYPLFLSLIFGNIANQAKPIIIQVENQLRNGMEAYVRRLQCQRPAECSSPLALIMVHYYTSPAQMHNLLLPMQNPWA